MNYDAEIELHPRKFTPELMLLLNRSPLPVD